MNFATVLSALLLVSCAIPAPAIQEAADAKEQDYELEENAVVGVRGFAGPIRVRGWDRKTARVKTTRSGRDRERLEVKVESTKSELQVSVRHPEDARHLDASVEIEVWIPVALKSLTLKTVSGEITVDDVRAAESRITTVSGAIRAANLKGDLAATSVSGGILAKGLAGGRAALTVTSGSIEGSGKLDVLEMTSVSGGATFDLAPGKDAWSVRASTVNGSIRLTLPAAAGAKVKCTTLSGEIRCDFPMKDKSGPEKPLVGHVLDGTFGGGTGSIHASTINGGVAILQGK